MAPRDPLTPNLPSRLPSDQEVDAAIPEREPSARTGHVVARVAIPLVLVVIGVVLLVLGVTLLGILFAFAGMIAMIADRLIRFGIVSQADRDREAAARQRMRRTGRWSR